MNPNILAPAQLMHHILLNGVNDLISAPSNDFLHTLMQCKCFSKHFVCDD